MNAIARQSLLPVKPNLDIVKLLPKKRDPHKFYFYETPEQNIVKRWAFGCEEFRHRLDPEVFDICVKGSYEGNSKRKGAIKIRLSASNLRQPFEKTFPVYLKVTELDLSEAMRQFLP